MITKHCRFLWAILLIVSMLAGAVACTATPATSKDQPSEKVSPSEASTAETSESEPPQTSAEPSESVVSVTGVKLNSSVMTLSVGADAVLEATVSPENADNRGVIWKSSDESVISVKDGAVKALSAGTAEVTVTTEDGGFTAACKILVKEEPIPVSGVTLNVGTYTMDPDAVLQLFASIVPANATNKNVSFMSSNEEVATVDEKGLVTAVDGGTAYITATSEDGGKKATCIITVNPRPVAVTGVFLDKKTASLMQGEKLTLQATVKPENADNQKISWATSDPEIATVDGGTVKALKPGSVTITVTSEDGGFSESCALTVISSNVPVSSVSLDKPALQLRTGATAALTATVLPENARNRSVTWSSSAADVVKVENGTLTAIKTGTADITVKTVDGGKTAVCHVTVIANDDPIDKIDLSSSTAIEDLGGYNGGLRVKTTGQLLFSPTLNELRDAVRNGAQYSDYLGYIRFTYLPEEDDEIEFTYHSICLVPQKSKGDWVDFFLQGDPDESRDFDCGFCPVAGATYRIELVVVKESNKTKGVYHGIYEMTAEEAFKDSQFYRPTPIGGQVIRNENQFYIRYVAAADNGYIEGEAKQLLDLGKGSTKVTAIPKEGYQFMMWSDGVTTPSREGDKVTFDTKIYAYFTVLNENSNVANMYIFTKSGKPVTSKNYEPATVVISNAPEGGKYNISASLQIRGRGNSSWNGGAAQSSYDSKNSYRLKFDEKLKLLGIGDSKNSDWVLQSNKFDLSSLRNWMVWDLADRMGTLPYVPEGTWVQLYVNNEYRGIYMVCELIETAKDRVDVDDSVAGEDKGFLLEFDFRGNGDTQPYFYVDGYTSDNSVEFVIKSKVNGNDEINAIKKYMQRCHDAIMSGSRAAIDKLVDIPSLIDMYIIEELSKDCDVGRASFFVQKDVGGKLYFTAPWDFDFGFGTYGPAVSNWGLVSQGDGVCPWYAALVEYKWFRDEVVKRMDELSDSFAEVMKDVRAKGAELEGAVDMSAYFWDQYGRSFHVYVSGQVSRNLFSYQEHIDFLVEWTEDRWEILHDLLKDY